MLLTGDQIRARGIVQNAHDDSFRTTSYDLRVASIYVPPIGQYRGHDNVNAYRLPPRGIALLFSAETLNIPMDICGQALPKTSLCEDGILILNTGILDPGYQGPISGMAINFGAKSFPINAGQPFLRLLFEELHSPEQQDPDEATKKRTPPTIEAYRAEKISKAIGYPSTFLDIRNIARRVSRRVGRRLLAEERRTILFFVGGAALFLALIQALAAVLPPRIYFSEDRVTRNVLEEVRKADASSPLGQITREQTDMRRTLEEFEKRAADLERRLERFERPRRTPR